LVGSLFGVEIVIMNCQSATCNIISTLWILFYETMRLTLPCPCGCRPHRFPHASFQLRQNGRHIRNVDSTEYFGQMMNPNLLKPGALYPKTLSLSFFMFSIIISPLF
jgi:hypothetical protein